MGTVRLAPLLSAALLASAASADLKTGDVLPNTSKIPLLGFETQFRPQTWGVASLESQLLHDGVAIVHFLSPRPPRGAAFDTRFVDDLSDLQMATTSVSYPCSAVAVVPFGEKGRADAGVVLAENEDKVWGSIKLFYEPTFPRPGLYRTFRPGAGDGGIEITTPWTYLIGPDRKILAVRAPDDPSRLYDWLQKNLPATVVPVARTASSAISLPTLTPWIWPSFRRSVQHQPVASNLPDVLPYTYLAWQAPIGRTFASPAVMDNVVYVNTDSRGLQSFALGTGQPLATFGSGNSWWSSPVVAGDAVITISAEGLVTAIDRARFTPKWRRNLNGLITSSPIVSDGTLFVGSRNGAVYAVDVANGDVLWVFQTGGEISSSPALSSGTLVIGSGDRSLYAIDAKTGDRKWSTATDGPVDSSPAIADGDVFVGSFDAHLYSMKLADGTVNWKVKLGGWVHSSPAVSEDTVYVGTVNYPRDEVPTFNWIDRKTGKRSGNFTMPDGVYSSPTVWGDLVLVGCRDYELYAFDRKMRQTQPAWTFRTRSYVHASPTVVGDTVLLASFDGTLYSLRQAKPIRVWNENDVVPRWFAAALTRELHKQTSELIARAATARVGEELSLKRFDVVLADIKSGAARPAAPPKVLPRDVPSEHPGAPYIEYVLTAGLLAGYPDGTFGPNEPTNRFQFAFGLSTVFQAIVRPDFAWRILGERGAQGAQVEVRVTPQPGRPRTVARDINANHWAHRALSDLADRALLPLDEEGLFRGLKTMTIKDAASYWNLFVDSIKVVRVK